VILVSESMAEPLTVTDVRPPFAAPAEVLRLSMRGGTLSI
jgi:hypothetical protein